MTFIEHPILEKFKYIKEEEQRLLRQCGWYFHGVIGVGYHTHGLPEYYNHKDIEIALWLEGHVGSDLFWGAVDLIKEGITFEPVKKYDRIVKNYDVVFTESWEGGREVLRMILPDRFGNLTRETMVGSMAGQWDTPKPDGEG